MISSTVRLGESVLPPSDRTDAPSTDAPSTDAPAPQGVDAGLWQRIQVRMASGLSQSDIARAIGMSSTTISRWISGKYPGDVAKLEWLLGAWERNVDQRVDMLRAFTPTRITRDVCAKAARITRTGVIGIIPGPAGIGKTAGLQLFFSEYPSAILLTAGQNHGGARNIINDLWRNAGTRRHDDENDLDKSEILCRRLAGSHIPIVIDEADKLTHSGLRFVKHLHDQTGCPIVLAGNDPRITKNIRSLPDADQFGSRVGDARPILWTDDDADELGRLMLQQFAPQYTRELETFAIQAANGRGHARRLKMLLRLTLDILEQKHGLKTLCAPGETEAQHAFILAVKQYLPLEAK